MINGDRAYDLFVAANPIPGDRGDEVVLDAASYLATLEKRSSEMTQIETMPETKPPGRGRGTWVAVAAAAVLLIATVGILMANSGDSEVVATTLPVTTVPAPTTASEGLTGDDAVASANALLASYNEGNFEGFMAAFTSSATVEAWGEVRPVADDAAATAWYIAQGTEIVDPRCSAVEEGDVGWTVRCNTGNTFTALHQVAGQPGVLTSLTLTVSDEGIEAIAYEYRGTDHADYSEPFDAWLTAHHPDAVGAFFKDFDSVEQATNDAQTRREYAGLWVEYGLNRVEEAFAVYNTGDLEGFLAYFRPDVGIFSMEPAEREVGVAALMASGDQVLFDSCGPVADHESMIIRCEGLFLDNSYTFGGVETGGYLEIRVLADGLLGTMVDGIDYPAAVRFHEQFQQWLSETHPEVHDATTWVGALPTAESYDLVEPYYAEFVAQSDEYPVGG